MAANMPIMANNYQKLDKGKTSVFPALHLLNSLKHNFLLLSFSGE